MALSQNQLVTVQTYADAALGNILNSFAMINRSNKKLENFQNLPGQLGISCLFRLQTRLAAKQGLVADMAGLTQRFETIVANQSANISYAFSTQQIEYNDALRYMDEVGDMASATLGTEIESYISKAFAVEAPYRFYGNGVTNITNSTQLGQAISDFKQIGATSSSMSMFLPVENVTEIVGSMQNQFVPESNEDLRMDWMIGNWRQCSFYETNLMPVHIAGTVGESGATLTVVSTNDPTGNAITQITFSGAAANDPDAVKKDDLFQFVQGPLFLTFVGNKLTQRKVQFRAKEDAGSNGSGQVTVSVYCEDVMCSVAGNPVQNLNRNIEAGMTVKGIPSHRCGLLVSGNALMLAMPQLGDLPPYDTVVRTDSDSGASIRMAYGSSLVDGTTGARNDAIWGARAVPTYVERIIFPLQG